MWMKVVSVILRHLNRRAAWAFARLSIRQIPSCSSLNLSSTDYPSLLIGTLLLNHTLIKGPSTRWQDKAARACAYTLAQPDKLNLIVKSLKPSLTFPISASPTDSISKLKSLVAASSPSAPPVDTQRLLLKGKALADNKLLKEYDISEGSTIHLVLKPTSVTIDPPTMSVPAPVPSNDPPALEAGASIQHGDKVKSMPSSSSASSIPRPAGHGHTRVPSLTITTDVDARPGSPGSPLIVTDAPSLGPQAQVSSAAFHQTVSNPQFWQKLHAICVSEFVYEDDADAAWEGFLVSMKGRLSAGEAALIRDVVGVRGGFQSLVCV